MVDAKNGEKTHAARSALWLLAGFVLVAIAVPVANGDEESTAALALVVFGLMACLIGALGLLAILFRTAKGS